MRRFLLLCLLLGCRRERSEATSDPALKVGKRVACTLPAEDPIVSAVSVPPNCDLVVDKTRKVGPSGSVTIGAGAKLAFAKNAALVIEGGSLIARGTKESPIQFVSGAAQPAPGDWIGLRFEPAPSASADGGATAAAGSAGSTDAGSVGSTLEWFVVEHAGQKPEAGVPAAISVASFDPRSIRLAHGRVRNNAAIGLRLSSKQLVGGEDLAFADNGGLSFEGYPRDLVALAESKFEEPIRLIGSVAEPVVLPSAPAYLLGRISIRGNKSPASLTFPEGSLVRFDRAGGIDIGHAFGTATGGTCTLVAKKVTFTSGEKAPAAGDWTAITIGDGCAATIEDSVLEYAGKKPGSVVRAGIELPPDESKLSIVRNTFRALGGPAFTTEKSCAPWSAPAKGNTFAGGKMCEVVISPAAKLAAILGSSAVLGSLGGSSGSVFGSSISDTDFGYGGLGLSGAGGGLAGSGGGGGIGFGAVGAKSLAKVTEVSVSSSGKLPNEVVRRLLRTSIPRLRACYGTSSATGTISARIDIDSKGSVSKVASTGGTLTEASVVSCVTSVLAALSFPEPESGAVVANATWNFQPP